MKRVSIFSLLFMLSLTYISCSTNKSGISENSSSSIDDNIQAAIYDTTLAADTTKAKKLIHKYYGLFSNTNLLTKSYNPRLF